MQLKHRVQLERGVRLEYRVQSGRRVQLENGVQVERRVQWEYGVQLEPESGLHLEPGLHLNPSSNQHNDANATHQLTTMILCLLASRPVSRWIGGWLRPMRDSMCHSKVRESRFGPGPIVGHLLQVTTRSEMIRCCVVLG